MRLTAIKLAGFKSFVDPTSLRFHSNMVGVVGPNGCGKSNIIDAVRWVMGEISARSLRGEAMGDVIFSGSSARRPTGQASVELVFDNSERKLGGPWGHYDEISIRRVVVRDAQSTYYLNGTRCRRRDITDIFLGTGLGPRSYGIIEQGTISRIVEAKPDDLRVIFEEAAGVSRYKERRRETENRIRHTRENLGRLDDVRQEVAGRIRQLQRQARAAERYRELREEERLLKGRLLALQWRAEHEAMAAMGAEAAEHEAAWKEAAAEHRRTIEALDAARLAQGEAASQRERAQARCFDAAAEVARLEQQIAHQRELDARHREDLERTEQALSRAAEQAGADGERVRSLEAALAAAEPVVEEATAAESERVTELAAAEQRQQELQAGRAELERRIGELRRSADVERTRLAHLQRQAERHRQQAEALTRERAGLGAGALKETMERQQGGEREAADRLQRAQSELAQVEQDLAGAREAESHAVAELDAARERVQGLRGRLASLETLQDQALEKGQEAVTGWLRERHLDGAPRLAECLEVEPGLEGAVETVLGPRLEAVCLPGLDAAAGALTELGGGRLSLFDTGAGGGGAAGGDLAARVAAPWPLDDLLAGVSLAPDLAAALDRRGGLGPGESLVTPEGCWVGRAWLSVDRGADPRRGVLAREREIHGLRAALAAGEEALARAGGELDRIRGGLAELRARRASQQEEVNQAVAERAHRGAQAKALQGQYQRAMDRQVAIERALEELQGQSARDGDEMDAAAAEIERAQTGLEAAAGDLERCEAQWAEAKEALRGARAAVDQARQRTREAALERESNRIALDSAREALERLVEQRDRLEERRAQLSGAISGAEGPMRRSEAALAAATQEKDRSASELAAARGTEEAAGEAVRALEAARSDREGQVEAAREAVEMSRLACGEHRARCAGVAERMAEIGADPDAEVAALPEGSVEEVCAASLQRVQGRIENLGAVNLAAIEELDEHTQRQQYLDAQHEDLSQALETLESAMRKLDRETRNRFKDTVEQIDRGIQALFPRLFGGGRAHLEILDGPEDRGGVAIMAQPPGKRIGNIHLLSGGEKALTAVAIVFAIFQLNPAPFCMLDEVDAPLDEANVGRFGELVLEMSQQVQFIIITHNKGTMEIASHLAGVTMNEPGVSRLVAVDVDDAVRLAAV